jgi:hypothetical protein
VCRIDLADSRQECAICCASHRHIRELVAAGTKLSEGNFEYNDP